jgi:hypothetical protein
MSGEKIIVQESLIMTKSQMGRLFMERLAVLSKMIHISRPQNFLSEAEWIQFPIISAPRQQVGLTKEPGQPK